MDKELRDRLYWLQEELTEEDRELLFDEEEDDESPSPKKSRLSRAQRQERRRLEEIDPIMERSAPVVKKKGIKGLVFLAVLEILGILLVIGWWLKWLI